MNNIGAALARPAALMGKSATIDAADPVIFIIDDDVAVRESLS
jgi:hypothetical protein